MAAELAAATKNVTDLSEQKQMRARELVIANQELTYQQSEKGARAAELEIANTELRYQNEQKERRAAELEKANIELAFQIREKEKRAAELAEAVKDLEAFAYVSSHHLREPLRKIRSFVDRVLEAEADRLTERGRHNLGRIDVAAARINQLIQDIYTYSRVNVGDFEFEEVEVELLVAEVVGGLRPVLVKQQAIVQWNVPGSLRVIPALFRQLLHLLLDNALKYVRPGVYPSIALLGRKAEGEEIPAALNASSVGFYCIEVQDNGLGFDPKFNDAIFGLFQRLHSAEAYPGTGVGLAIVSKIMSRHGGFVTASGASEAGACFRIYFPVTVPTPVYSSAP